jgi:hypothetical protein
VSHFHAFAHAKGNAMAPQAYVRRTLLAAAALAAGALAWSASLPAQARVSSPPPVGQAPRTDPEWKAPPEEDAVYRDAARTAFTYLKAHRSPKTGLVAATPGWANITLWDVGSLVGAVYAAGELGLLSGAERDQWMTTLLHTLANAPIVDHTAFNRTYVVANAGMLGDKDVPTRIGSGWSTTDLGRLLIWLKVVETKLPSHAAEARAVAQRIDFDRIVQGGALKGAEMNDAGKPFLYDEGRVGYEQYAARGFELWGHPAARSLDPRAHARPVTVMGQTLLHDTRGNDKLTSEPFILMGMETGFRGPFDNLARAMLAVQQARYEKTGTVTMVSEDAVQVAPWYFYYYSVYSEGETFAVRAHGPVKNGPRWVSAKAAFAWHALYPSAYTWTAVQAVQPARHADGWASGVFEKSTRSTGIRNLNTAAVILEAALYRKLGRPILS